MTQEQSAKKKRTKRKKKMEFSKKCFLLIVLNCSVVELYSMAAMWHFSDLSALYSLIGAVVGESLAYISYCAKAKKENTRGGITYDMAMQEQVENSEAVG